MTDTLLAVRPGKSVLSEIGNSRFFIAISNSSQFLEPIAALIEAVIVSESVTQLIKGNRFHVYIAVTVGSFLFIVPELMAKTVQYAVGSTSAK